MISSDLISAIQSSKRPIFIWGAGMRQYAKGALALARSLGIPVATTWGAIDLMNHDDTLMAGGFGTHGQRAANLAVQNADLVLSLGSRLDTKATGTPAHFARSATRFMVDIDGAEIRKFAQLGLEITGIEADAGEFIESLDKASIGVLCRVPLERTGSAWIARIQQWKQRYSTPTVDWPGVNPYALMKQISTYTTADDIIVSDTGCALGWLMQGFPFKGERFIHALNMTPMGYGLPAAIGAAFASGKRVVLITGDGSIMMSLPELATVSKWHLPIKIILLNNQGHAMCRQTQRQWLNGNYPATSVEGGLAFPSFNLTAIASDIYPSSDLRTLFAQEFADKPRFMEVQIHPDAQLVPQAKYGQPLEDADPLMPWDELCEQMIIPPLERPQ